MNIYWLVVVLQSGTQETEFPQVWETELELFGAVIVRIMGLLIFLKPEWTLLLDGMFQKTLQQI